MVANGSFAVFLHVLLPPSKPLHFLQCISNSVPKPSTVKYRVLTCNQQQSAQQIAQTSTMGHSTVHPPQTFDAMWIVSSCFLYCLRFAIVLVGWLFFSFLMLLVFTWHVVDTPAILSYKKYGFIPFCALIWRLSTQSFRRRTYCTTALCNSFVARPCNKVSWRKDLQKCFAWMIPFSTRLVRACSTPALSKSGPQKLDTKTHKQKCTKRCRAGRYLQRFWCLVIICYHFCLGSARGGAMINIHCRD